MKVGGVIGGKYRLSRIIGKGAMGTVWAASNELTSREVAIKLIGDSTQDLRIRLMREAKACGSLSHRNIIDVLDVGQTDTGDPFLVMQLLQGETLAEHLERHRRVAPTAAARIARDIARALSYAHRAGIVHRDLKPANIFLHHEPGSDDFVVKVLDFGVSKNLYNREAIATVAGGAIGSPAYMSPEQINPTGTVDFLSDLWSLGVVLFEMLTGQRPFQGDSVHVLTQVTVGEIPRVSKHLWRIDPALDELVFHCMERDRSARIQSADEVVKALDAYLANEISQITVASPLTENQASEHRGLKGTLTMDNVPADVVAARKTMRKSDPNPGFPASPANPDPAPSEEVDDDIQTVPVNSAMLAHLNFPLRPAQTPPNTRPSSPPTAPAPSPPSENETHLMPVPNRIPTTPPFMGLSATVPLQPRHVGDAARPSLPASETPKPASRLAAAPSFGPPPPPLSSPSQVFSGSPAPPASFGAQSNPIRNTNDSTVQLIPDELRGARIPTSKPESNPPEIHPALGASTLSPPGGYPAAPAPAFNTLSPPSSYPSTPYPGDRLSTTSASGALHVPDENTHSPYFGTGQELDEEEAALRKRGQRLMIMVGIFSALVVTTIVLLFIPALKTQSNPDEPASSASASASAPKATPSASAPSSAALLKTSSPTNTPTSTPTTPASNPPPAPSIRTPQAPPLQSTTKSSGSKPAPSSSNKTKSSAPSAPFHIDWDAIPGQKPPKPSTTGKKR